MARTEDVWGPYDMENAYNFDIANAMKEHFVNRLEEKGCTCRSPYYEDDTNCMTAMFDNLPEYLRNDRDIWELAIQIHDEIFEDASEIIKNDKKFRMKLAKIKPTLLRYMGEDLADDEEFVTPLVKNDANIFRYVSPRLKNKREFSIPILTDNISMFGSLP